MFLQEREKAMEKMGISLGTKGVKLNNKDCCLVNLNSDPHMDSMLVYMLNVRECVCVVLSTYKFTTKYTPVSSIGFSIRL